VADEPVFEIRLSATAPEPGLEAVLVNRSGAGRIVLLNPDLQPSRLILTDAAGREAAPFDERTRRKLDRSVSRGMYFSVTPRGSVPLESAAFRKLPGGQYELRWGPFVFRSLAPGAWRARVRFESSIDYVTGRGRRVPVPGVWKGAVESNEIEVRLPEMNSR
jgi:hypothetical protein